MLIFMGLCAGSFVNALVWRLHEQQEAPQKKDNDLSILRGRSMCPHCHHTLAANDLVPLASWLYLRGKCRYCHASISVQYPLIEGVTALLFVGSYAFWPNTFSAAGTCFFVGWLLFVTGAVALVLYDMRWFLLPDRIVFPLIAIAAIESLAHAFLFGGGWHGLAVEVLSVLCIAGPFFILHAASHGTWIGFGDVKLAIALGLFVRLPLAALLVIFFAAVLGSFASIPLLLKGKTSMKAHIPFGPFLLAATYIVLLWGMPLLHWYAHFFV